MTAKCASCGRDMPGWLFLGYGCPKCRTLSCDECRPYSFDDCPVCGSKKEPIDLRTPLILLVILLLAFGVPFLTLFYPSSAVTTGWDNLPISGTDGLQDGQFVKISGRLARDDTVALRAREVAISGDWVWGYPRDDIVLMSDFGNVTITLRLEDAYILTGAHASGTLNHTTSGDYWVNDTVVAVGTVKDGPNGTLALDVRAMGPAGAKFDAGYIPYYELFLLSALILPAIIVIGYEAFRRWSYERNSEEKAVHPKDKIKGEFRPITEVRVFPNKSGVAILSKEKLYWAAVGALYLAATALYFFPLRTGIEYLFIIMFLYIVPTIGIIIHLTMELSKLFEVPMAIGMGEDGVVFQYLLGKKMGYRWSDIIKITSIRYGDPRYRADDPISITLEFVDDFWSVEGVSYDLAVGVIKKHRSIVGLPSILDVMKEIAKECEGEEKTLWLEAVAILGKAGIGTRHQGVAR